jgi:hypothetical protein
MHAFCLLLCFLFCVADSYNASNPFPSAAVERDPHSLAHLTPSTSVLHILRMVDPTKVRPTVVKSVAIDVVRHHPWLGPPAQNEPRERVGPLPLSNPIHSE